MKCFSCGKDNEKDARYCRFCGAEINPNKPKHISKAQLEKLEKTYRNAGIWSIVICLIAVADNLIVVIGHYVGIELLTYIAFLFSFYSRFLFVGNKLRTYNLSNLDYGLKASKEMLFYTSISIVVNLFLGVVGSLPWLLLFYFYYKAYKDTKKILKV